MSILTIQETLDKLITNWTKEHSVDADEASHQINSGYCYALAAVLQDYYKENSYANLIIIGTPSHVFIADVSSLELEKDAKFIEAEHFYRKRVKMYDSFIRYGTFDVLDISELTSDLLDLQKGLVSIGKEELFNTPNFHVRYSRIRKLLED